MPRLTKIYTRKGDDGTTKLGSGERVGKDSPRVEAYGTLDELNAHIGAAIAVGLDERLAGILQIIQNELFHLGAQLSMAGEKDEAGALPGVTQERVRALESLIDELNREVGPLENFILPGGAAGAAALHLARTVCRRAERRLAALIKLEAVNPIALRYLNRLSDALFVFARYENFKRGVDQPLWDSRA